jgi:hypothetical protein
MNKILLILFSAGLLMACNSGNNNMESEDLRSAEKSHNEQEKISEGLVLNNGAKWKADSITLFNVAILQNVISETKKESLEDYYQIATQLQSVLKKMVAECKMKGADHDALHQWLEPLLKRVNDLNKETSTDNAAANLNEIEKHLKLFAQYFELQGS